MVVEPGSHVFTKVVASSSQRWVEAVTVVRVRPQQIAQRALLRGLLEAVQALYLVDGVNVRRETTVKAEDAIFN